MRSPGSADYERGVKALIDRCFGSQGEVLRTGGVEVTSLAQHHGTPLFVYDRRALDRALDSMRTVLPQGFDVYYSVKANPNPAIVRHFVSRGCGLEIASAGEFLGARAAGCAAQRILFAGPGKTEAELALVLRQGIGEIHLESPLEARRITAICKQLGARAKVAVRVNPAEEAQGGAMRMGGKAAPFGVDEEQLDHVLDHVLAESCLNLQGIHLYAGTQILDVEVLVSQYRRALHIARRVAARTAAPVRTVDFGGGWGIPYFPHESPLDLEALRMRLARLMEEISGDAAFRGTRFVVEPGRFLVGEAGVYVARIIDIKRSRDKKFVIIDGGMNHHLAASGNLGQTIKRNYPIALLNKLNHPLEETVEIVGPLCTPLDVLGRSIEFPKSEVGDLVGIFQSGAYALSASPTGFLSHATPAEVLVADGAEVLIRPRGQVTDSAGDMPAGR